MERLTEKRLEAIKARHGWGWRLERSESEELLGEINALRHALQAIESRLAIAVEALRHYADTPVSGVAERALAAIEAPACAHVMDGDGHCGKCGAPSEGVVAKTNQARCPGCVQHDDACARCANLEGAANASAETVRHLQGRLEAAEKRVAELEGQLTRTKRAWKIHADHVDACPMLDDDAVPVVPQLEARIAELEAQLSKAKAHAERKERDYFAELQAHTECMKREVAALAERDQLRAQLAGERRTYWERELQVDDYEWRRLEFYPDKASAVNHSARIKAIDPGDKHRIVEVTEIRRTLDTTDTGEKK